MLQLRFFTSTNMSLSRNPCVSLILILQCPLLLFFCCCFFFFRFRYIHSLQSLCRQIIRIGSMTDGGKEICVDEAYRPKAPCLVYSFG